MRLLHFMAGRYRARGPICLRVAVGAALVVTCVIFWAAPSRAANTACTPAAASAAAPPGVTIGDIPDLSPALPKTTAGVADIPAGFFGPGAPEVCLITGSVVTNSATQKTANFGAVLPLRSAWNGKFLFEGCGGDCGSVMLAPTADVLSKGYPVWATDDGHLGTNPAWPISAPGVRDEDAIVDFAYRAVHTVVADGKAFTLNYFGASKFAQAYYEGCSDGGREGMMEANRYPDDFDGVIAGDPYFDVPGQNIIISNLTVQFALKNAQISPAQLAIASQIVMAQCDSADGVKDGLIQNPALCRFNPMTDLPKCPHDTPAAACFTPGQRRALWTILAALTDSRGGVVHTGFPASDMNSGPGANLAAWTAISTPPSNRTGPEPWPGDIGAPFDWIVNDSALKYWADFGSPNYNSLTTPGFTYQRDGPGPINVFHTTAPLSTVERIYATMDIASADFPGALEPFVAKNKKLILYHGYSDGFITPYTTIQYYAALATLAHGFGPLQRNVRLFMVPGMYHCSGGPGPDNFGQSGVQPAARDALHDATTALEAWVEHGTPPETFVATKFVNDTPAMGIARTMPLCPFPSEASYRGGNVNAAPSWSCNKADSSLLTVGFDGFEAGLVAGLYQPPR